MKIGLNAWTVEKTVDMPGMFEAVKNAGFDVLEMNIDKPTRSLHSLSFETTAADYEAVRALSKAHDLPVTSISSSLWDAQMGRKEQWDEAEALLYKQLEAAQELGGTGILICPGGQDEDHSMVSTRKNCIDFLKAHRDEIERRNIFVGVENIWNCFFLSAYDMASFIDEVGSAKIGAYLDLGNMLVTSHPQDWVEILGSRIGKCHIKDFKRNGFLQGGDWDVLIGDGDGQWDKVMDALAKVGYSDTIIAEVFKMQQPGTYEDFYKVTCERTNKVVNG